MQTFTKESGQFFFGGGGGSKCSPQHMTAVGSISGPIKGALCSFAEDEKDLR